MRSVYAPKVMAYTPIRKSIRVFSKNELFLIESVVLNLRHCLFPHFQTNLSLVLLQARQSIPLEQYTQHMLLLINLMDLRKLIIQFIPVLIIGKIVF